MFKRSSSKSAKRLGSKDSRASIAFPISSIVAQSLKVKEGDGFNVPKANHRNGMLNMNGQQNLSFDQLMSKSMAVSSSIIV